MSLRVAFAWYYLSGMVGLRHAEAGLRAASVGYRISPAWYYLTGMMGLRLTEAGLRGPPHVARMALFDRYDEPPPRGGRPPTTMPQAMSPRSTRRRSASMGSRT